MARGGDKYKCRPESGLQPIYNNRFKSRAKSFKCVILKIK